MFFRSETQRQSLLLGLKGWVKNTYDGRVEAVFEGNETDIKKISDWCKKGPEVSIVKALEIVEESPTGDFKDFEIVY